MGYLPLHLRTYVITKKKIYPYTYPVLLSTFSSKQSTSSPLSSCCLAHLLDQRVRGEEGVVLLGEFLDQVLVLVELLQVLHRHAVKADLLSLLFKKGDKRAKKRGEKW